MLKIIFFIRTGKANSNGDCPIYAKVTYQGKTISISTRKSISKHRWGFTNNLRNPLKIEKEKIIKASLDRIASQIEYHFNQLVKNNSIIDLYSIKNDVLGKPAKDKQETSILKIFEVHNTEFKKKVEIGERAAASLQKYCRSKDLIESFLNKKYSLKDINVDKMNGAFIYNLESYLKYESVYKGKVGIKNNSVVKYFKTFKTICNFAIKLELISKNPFSKYDGKLQIKDAIYLTQDELNKIEEKSFGIDRLERVKDIFLFSCYTGYAPIDAENLKHDNLIKNNDGDLWIVTDRVKTGIRANVPVLPTVKRIIDKYKGLQSGLIPKISNQKMNAYLKEIADICGIKKNLTWYVARHTFATTITLGNGIKLENVSAMMGHSNIKQTQHYAKVLDSSYFQ